VKNRLLVIFSIMIFVLSLSVAVFAEVTIEFQMLDNGPEYQATFNKLIKMFEKENSDIKVKPIYAGWDHGHEKLLVRFGSGNPPEIAQFNDDFIGDYSHKDILEPLNDLYDDFSEFYQAPLDLATIDGKLRSISIAYKPRVIYYNKDWFDEAGVEPLPDHWNDPDWDWDAFLAKVKKLTEAADNKEMASWGVTIDYPQIPFWWIHNAAPTDEDRLIMNNQSKFAEPYVYETTQWLADLHFKHQVQPSLAIDEDVGQRELFLSQRVAMIVNGGSWELPFLRDADFNWEIGPYPTNNRATTQASLVNFGVIRNSKHPQEAKRFIRFLLEPSSQDILSKELGMMPARKSVAEKLEWTEPISAENGHLYLEAMENAAFGPWDTPGWYQSYRLAGPSFESIFSGQSTAKEALTKLDKKVQDLLDDLK